MSRWCDRGASPRYSVGRTSDTPAGQSSDGPQPRSAPAAIAQRSVLHTWQQTITSVIVSWPARSCRSGEKEAAIRGQRGVTR
jgi:hypothetical protein